MRGPVVDVYHGVEVADPYRWLEYDSPERTAWMNAQGELLEQYAPPEAMVESIREGMENIYPDVLDSIRFTYGDRAFLQRFYKGQNYSQLIELLPDGGERVVTDPNTWSPDGSIAPAGRQLSPQGNYLAQARSPKDNDEQEWTIINVTTGEELPDSLPQAKNTATHWLEDESGFFYCRTLDNNQRVVYFHTLGSHSDTDQAYFTPEADDKTYYGSSLSHDNRWLYIYGNPPAGSNTVDVIDLQSGSKTPTRLVEADTTDTSTYVIFNHNDAHILATEQGSPKGRVIRLVAGQDWQDVVPESDDVLENASVVADRLIARYNDGLRSYLKIFEMNGQLVDTILPPDEVGITSFGYYKFDNPEAYVTFESPVRPATTYSYNVLTGETALLKASELLVDTSNYRVGVDYATSKDGTKVPIVYCAPKDLVADGTAPTILYGYGGFSSSMRPYFNSTALPWLENGGVYAIAYIRGGGEFGNEWHEAGTKLGKQRVFDDFIACAEQLIDSKITSPDSLVIMGGSNGGLLVGASLLQRPELFRVAMPSSGLLDMLRYDKDEHAEAGVYWQAEYGTTDNEAEFLNLLSYSPVHNTAPAKYPVVYASVGEHDDRVLPSHTYKFIAGLQAAQLALNPILIDIDTSSGHGLSGAARNQQETAKEYAFLFQTLGVPYSAI